MISLYRAEAMSDSEYDDPAHHVNLPQNLGKGNLEDNKSSIRLYELGPRITFQLIKIEEDLMNGEVLYHDFIVKTEQEQEEIRKNRDAKKKLKQARKVQQESNLKRKELQKDDHKKKSLKGNRQATDEDKKLLKDAEDAIVDVPEDDAEYYKEEVGLEPEAELFKGQQERKRPYVPKGFRQGINKKPRMDKDHDKSDKHGREGKQFKSGGKRGGPEGKSSYKGKRGGPEGKSSYKGKRGQDSKPFKSGKSFNGKRGQQDKSKNVSNKFGNKKFKKNNKR
jgi:ribosome biogenesis protein SSF1/2